MKKEMLLKIKDPEETSHIDFKERDVEIIALKRNNTRKKTKGMGNKQSIYNVKYSNEINNEKNNINLLNSNSNLQGVDQEIFKRKKSGISQSDKLENITNINYYNSTPNHIEDHQENNNYLKKVRLNRACVYLWFCFVRRRKILDNILIDEGMDFISKRLDIFNLFDKVYKLELRNEKINNKVLPMSDECKTRLKLLELEQNLNKPI